MRGPSWGGDFAETNALAFGSQGPAEARKNHVEKRKRKAKGLEIVFDPQAHKEFLTGFQKRKQERRNKAKRQVAEKEKKQRLEDRAERRAQLRDELDLQRYETPPQSEDEQPAPEDGAGKSVRVYKLNDTVTTVTTASVYLNSDEEKEAGDVDGTCSASEANEVAPTEPHNGEEKMTIQAPARKLKRSKGQSAKHGKGKKKGR